MKVLTYDGLGHLVQKIREIIPKKVTRDADGLVPALPESETQVLLSTGEWGDVKTGGGIGVHTFEVDDAGNLYLVYDDNYEKPNYEYDESSGNLYVVFNEA